MAAAALTLTGLSGCATPQTLMPYTPAEGVNTQLDAGQGSAIKVRNLMVISKTPGQGFLSGAILAPAEVYPGNGGAKDSQPAPEDVLTSVQGTALTPAGAAAAPLSPVQTNLTLPPGRLVVLTDQPAIRLNSPDLKAGLLCELTLSFRSGAKTTMRVPVVDGLSGDLINVQPK